MKKDLEMSKRILKNILLKELTEAGEQYNPEDNIETPFEKDPMGFILKKYTTLNDILTELMSESFKEYLDAIFIVAPKPTTFKVMLHNGQFFFLTFTGKAYQATVQGKDYYLMTIGEKERCMQAIARVLRYGSPLKTKGPEGAEQGTRPEGEETGISGGGGGENTGMEGDWAEKTGNASPASEEGGEEEETVSESAVLVEALKKTLDGEKSNVFDFLRKGLNDQGSTGKPDSKRGRHLRYNIGSEKDVLSSIDNILKPIGKNTYRVDVIPADEFSKGAKSGKYPTYKISITKDSPTFKKGDEVFLVNQQTEKSKIVAKSLTATNLGISGKTFANHQSLNSALKSSLTSLKDKTLSEILISMTDLVDREVSARYKNVSDLKDYEDSIPFDQKTASLISKVSDQDLNVIGKDYGEELGALALLKSLTNPEKGVEFPKGNNPLADFFLDGYSISSKYEKGAAATLTSIVEGIDEKKLTNKNQKELYKVLKVVVSNGVADGYIQAGIAINTPAIKTLSAITKISPDKLTAQSINDYLQKLLSKSKSGNSKNQLLIKTFSKFYSQINRGPKNNVVDWDKISPERYAGVVIGPLSYHIADAMNANPSYSKALTELLSKIEVKQLYLNFSLSKKTINFKLKSFTDPNAKFKFDIGSQSIYNPNNSRLGFKLQ